MAGTLGFTRMQCCAGMQIYGLMSFKPNEMKTALIQVCEQAFGRSPGSVRGSKPFSFYIFNGVIQYRKGSHEAKQPDIYLVGYVEAFRDYILSLNVGEIVETKPEWNRVGAPGHRDLMCIWRPNVIKLKKWYQENKPPAPPPSAQTIPETITINANRF